MARIAVQPEAEWPWWGLEAGGLAGAAGDVRPGAAAAEDPGFRGQVGEGRGGGRGQGVVGRQGEVEGVGEQGYAGEAGVGRAGGLGGEGQGEVDVTGGQQVVGRGGLRLPYADGHPGVRLAQGPYGRYDEGGHRRGEGADPDLARLAARVGRQGRVGALQLLEHRLGVGQYEPGGVGEPDPPSVRLQQGHAEPVGEIGELLGHRGRGHVQGLGRRGHGPPLAQGAQDLQLADVPLGHARTLHAGLPGEGPAGARGPRGRHRREPAPRMTPPRISAIDSSCGRPVVSPSTAQDSRATQTGWR